MAEEKPDEALKRRSYSKKLMGQRDYSQTAHNTAREIERRHAEPHQDDEDDEKPE